VPRAYRTTTQRGLGSAHQAERARQLEELSAFPGLPCPHVQVCGGLPMFATPGEAAAAGLHRRLWWLDLDDWPGRRYGGPQVKRLAHRYCNRRLGQVVTTQILRARAAQAGRRSVFNRW
jgi:hypothetical protein